MTSKIFIYLTNDGKIGFKESFESFHRIAEVTLMDVCDLMFGYSQSNELTIRNAYDGVPAGTMKMDVDILVIKMNTIPLPLHVSPRRILILMCSKCDTNAEWEPEDHILRVTNIDEDLEILRNRDLTICCEGCGIKIPEPPEDADASELLCDTCYKVRYGDE
jgi:hypothetical protein